FSRALQTYLVRSGHFVGPEEVAQFVRTIFADRIQKREAHLNWAAEVTSTVNVDKLRSGKGSAGDDAPTSRAKPVPPPPAPGPSHGAPSQTPASGERPRAPVPAPPPPAFSAPPVAPLASQSLMDDDEDVPTTVAMREDLDLIRPGLRPAAGLPAPPGPAVPPPGAAYNPASYAANAGRPPA